MEPIVSSETSANKIQTPGMYPNKIYYKKFMLLRYNEYYPEIDTHIP
jgi:hypothetical protein